MHAYYLHGARDLRLQSVETPRPGPDEVLVRVRRVGICGSDMEYYSHGICGDFEPRAPFVLGHEVMGEVAEVGSTVSDLEPGARVAVDPATTCGRCRHCREGRINLCQNVRFLGSASVVPHVDGGLREFMIMPAANCLPLPERVSDGEGALLEPLSVALHAVERAGALLGRRVLVTGGGTIGLLVALAARHAGAGFVALSDPDPSRRERAENSAVHAAFAPSDPRLEQEGESGFDVVFEASGAGQALAQAIGLARRGGTIVQIGTLPSELALPVNRIMGKELALLGSFRFTTDMVTALDLLAEGALDVGPILSETYGFEETEAAFETAVSPGDHLKIQIDFGTKGSTEHA